MFTIICGISGSVLRILRASVSFLHAAISPAVRVASIRLHRPRGKIPGAHAMLRVVVFFVLVCLTAPVMAAEPPAGSEDYDQLMPYADWISGRTGKYGGLCCSISDCRVVKWRTEGDKYQAYVAKLDDRGFVKFPDAPDAWLTVPTDVIKRENNPTGVAIACWSAFRNKDSGFYCFFLPNMT